MWISEKNKKKKKWITIDETAEKTKFLMCALAFRTLLPHADNATQVKKEKLQKTNAFTKKKKWKKN